MPILPLSLVSSYYVYGFVTPIKIPPSIHFAIIMEQYNSKVLYKKLNSPKLGKERQADEIWKSTG